MATIDPNIVLQGRQVADPLESYGKAMSLKSLATQQRMQEAQFSKYEADQQAEAKLNDLYRGNIGMDGQVNRQGILSGAASAGLGSRIPSLQKGFADADKATADAAHQKSQTSEVDFKLQKQKLEIVNGAMSSLLSRPAVTHDDVIGAVNNLVNQGLIAPEQGAQMARQLPGDPARLREFLIGKALETADASKRLEALTPKYQQVDAGNRVIPGTVNQMTGQFSPQGAPIVKAPEGYTVGPDGALTADPGFIRGKSQIAAAGRPVTNVNVNTNKTLLNEVASGLGKQLDDGLNAASSASTAINSARSLRNVLATGKVITGPGADFRLAGLQLANALGVSGKDSEETLANTRTAIQNLAQGELTAAQSMKGQGAITDAERAMLKRAAGGDINLTTGELKALANTIERNATARITSHQANVQRLKNVPGGDSLIPFYEAPQVPAEQPAARPAAQAAQPAPAQTWKDAGYASQAQAVQDAMGAISRGADKAAVVQRLEAAGITNHGIR